MNTMDEAQVECLTRLCTWAAMDMKGAQNSHVWQKGRVDIVLCRRDRLDFAVPAGWNASCISDSVVDAAAGSSSSGAGATLCH